MRRILALLLLIPFNAQAVRLTASFSNAKDSATCDWNTSLGIIRAPQESNGAALNYGDGSDGDCNFSGTVTAGTYQCRSLTITGNARFTGNTPVIIRVQGNVSISGTLSVDGFPGNIGNQTSPAVVVTNGGDAGPGGYDGGYFDSSDFPYAFAGVSRIATVTTPAPVDGSGGGYGGGYDGLISSSNPTEFAGGSGGAGGDFGDGGLATIGSVGTVTGAASAGSVGVLTPRDTAADEDGFEALFIGGAGGGAGGQGDEDGTNVFHYGGSGGGGGGALRIIAGGNITVTGTISANGGAGGNAVQLGGGGGGGSGGSIWLQAGGQVTNNGTIRALGGSGGTVTSSLPASGGNGGQGGDGRIRIDDIDGALTGNATTPVAQLSNGVDGIYDVGFQVAACTALTTALDTIGITNKFKSATAIQTLNGGTLTVQVQDSDDGTAWGALVPLSQVATLTKRYLRIDISLTPASAASSPILDAINVDYDIEQKSEVEFKSDVTCGSIDFDDTNQGPGSSVLIGLLLALLLIRKNKKLESKS